jgi:hypothetical protein
MFQSKRIFPNIGPRGTIRRSQNEIADENDNVLQISRFEIRSTYNTMQKFA